MLYFCYSDKYTGELTGHVFPIEKYKMVYERLKSKELITDKNLIEPIKPLRKELSLVHTNNYLDDLFNLRFTHRTYPSELPLNQKILDFFLITTGGTISAAKMACKHNVAINLAGGYHHAFPDRAEGFCYLNDVAISIRLVQKEKLATKILIVDLDLHQGNGNAYIFRDDPTVFTFSMHQENNYPIKQRGDLDIGLDDNTTDIQYLEYLQKILPGLIEKQKPELIFYLAGADPYYNDILGGLSLTKEGLKKRDEFVINKAHEKNIPICIVLAGGYAENTNDIVDIHCNTCYITKKYSEAFS